MKIILLGYMASGKSTIGRLLVKIFGYKFIDLDSFIEKKEEKSISDIFKDKGEVYFRKVENLYLKKLLANQENCIISLGGGTPCYANNMQLIKEDRNAISFFLKTSVKEIVNRLIIEKDERPLVSGIDSKDSMTEFVSKHLFERNPFYSKADYVLNTDGKAKEKIVEEIVFKLF
ncbi:MAG: shikimate kinase [Bacteroidia bacterium]|nr:shikimate kinase [Bacteroidia bacterium]